MVETMNDLLDEVVRSVQARVAELEMEVAELRSEVSAVRRELEAARGDEPEIVVPSATLERRVDRLERRLDASDIADE